MAEIFSVVPAHSTACRHLLSGENRCWAWAGVECDGCVRWCGKFLFGVAALGCARVPTGVVMPGTPIGAGGMKELRLLYFWLKQ
jgi:hypothetical protein